MTIHTCATFWEAVRAIVPNLPADDVTRCVITVDPSRAPYPVVELTMLAKDEAGQPRLVGIESDEFGSSVATETRQFKIVPIVDPTT